MTRQTITLLIFLAMGISSCDDLFNSQQPDIIQLPGGAAEILSDKVILSVEVNTSGLLVLSSSQCDTCYVPPHASYIPTIEQLTYICDTGFNCTEPSDAIFTSTGPDGIFYYATGNAVFRMNETGGFDLVVSTGDFHFNGMVVEQKNHLWLYGYSGIAYWEGLSLEIYNAANSPLPGDIVHSMAVDASGIAWAALDFEGLLKIDGDNWMVIPNDSIPGMRASSYLRNIIVDRDNNLWMNISMPDTTSNILKYDRLNGTFLYPSPQQSGSLHRDSDRKIWITSSTAEQGTVTTTGLYYMENGTWKTFDISSIASRIFAVNANELQVFLGTREGLVILER